MDEPVLKRVVWMGSSLEDLRELSDGVRHGVGFALYHAQLGDRHRNTKVLKGFGGADVLEVIENDDGGTYRAVYTVRFARAVYVLHVFQKKSRRGIRTPRKQMDLIHRRLTEAKVHYEQHKDEFQKKRKENR